MIRVLCMVKVRNRDMIYFISVHLSVFLVSSCLLCSVLTGRSSPLFPGGTFTVAHYFTCSFYVNELIDLFFFFCGVLTLSLNSLFIRDRDILFVVVPFFFKSHVGPCTDLKSGVNFYVILLQILISISIMKPCQKAF